MNWALKRFLGDLAEEYEARTGLDIGDLPRVAQDAIDGQVVSPLREPSDIAYAHGGGNYPIATVDGHSLDCYPDVVAWAGRLDEGEVNHGER